MMNGSLLASSTDWKAPLPGPQSRDGSPTHAAEHTPTGLVHSALVAEQHDLRTDPGIT